MNARCRAVDLRGVHGTAEIVGELHVTRGLAHNFSRNILQACLGMSPGNTGFLSLYGELLCTSHVVLMVMPGVMPQSRHTNAH